jgi:hypothetical protein
VKPEKRWAGTQELFHDACLRLILLQYNILVFDLKVLCTLHILLTLVESPCSLGQSIHQGNFVYFVRHPDDLTLNVNNCDRPTSPHLPTPLRPSPISAAHRTWRGEVRRGVRRTRPACERCLCLPVRARCAHGHSTRTARLASRTGRVLLRPNRSDTRGLWARMG